MMILDTETTGLVENLTTRSDHQPEIIEFCGIDIDLFTGDIRKEYDTLIKPIFPITDEIMKMNGITNEMVKNAPSFKEASEQIRDMIESSDIIVAHNASFDRDMIDLEIKKIGMSKIAWPRLICSVEATVHLTGFRLNLQGLYEHLFNVKFPGAHRARADVEALTRCVMELKKRGDI